MNRSTRQCAGLIVGLAALTATAFGGLGGLAPAGAAPPNPCKILKKSEIQSAFGGTVSSGKKGLSTAVTTQCDFDVSPDGDRPAGTVTVHVMFKNGKIAYKGLKKETSQYQPIEGVPNSLWQETTHAAEVLVGDTLVGVQGGFLITDPLPIHSYDDKAQLTKLVQTAAKRV
jgi:hypothetical protein